MTRRLLATVIAAASIGAACGHNPAAPTSSIPPAPVAPLGMAGTLSIAAFNIAGWHDDAFNYRPTVRVDAERAGGDLFVRQLEFRVGGEQPGRLLALIRLGNARVPAGGSLDMSQSLSNEDLVSPTALTSIALTITVGDDAGHTGTVSGEATIPPIPEDHAAATLVIHDFAVAGWYEPTAQRFYYWPKLTLAETSGVGPVSIVKIVFELLDVGAAGGVPPTLQTFTVAAGGTLRLDEDPIYGDPWLAIDSKAEASRVSVVISYVDSAGRGATVSGVAEVSR
jgi:hypothetical protein